MPNQEIMDKEERIENTDSKNEGVEKTEKSITPEELNTIANSDENPNKIVQWLLESKWVKILTENLPKIANSLNYDNENHKAILWWIVDNTIQSGDSGMLDTLANEVQKFDSKGFIEDTLNKLPDESLWKFAENFPNILNKFDWNDTNDNEFVTDFLDKCKTADLIH